MTEILKNASIEQMETAIAKALEEITGETLSVDLQKVEYQGTNMFRKRAEIQMVVHHRAVQQEGEDPILF